jgi:hypothetical protein
MPTPEHRDPLCFSPQDVQVSKTVNPTLKQLEAIAIPNHRSRKSAIEYPSCRALRDHRLPMANNEATLTMRELRGRLLARCGTANRSRRKRNDRRCPGSGS